MAKVEIIEALKGEVMRKFGSESKTIFRQMRSLEENPKKGKVVGNVGGIVIKEIKYKKFRLLYPYKKNSLNFRMWKKYYSGASGLMGLKIKAKNVNSIRKFVNSLKLFGYGYSWGGFESLVLHQEFRETGNRKLIGTLILFSPK